MHYSSFTSMSWQKFFKVLEAMEDNLMALLKEDQNELAVEGMGVQLLLALVQIVEQPRKRKTKELEANFCEILALRARLPGL